MANIPGAYYVTPGLYGPSTYYIEKCEAGYVIANGLYGGSPKEIANQLILESRKNHCNDFGDTYVWPFCINISQNRRQSQSCVFTLDLKSKSMTSDELDVLSLQISTEFNRLVTFL